mmetsp:Transcript_2704/g.5265  ORF Transcript_2704/g.5265 Transcript_2704/m.5265 type:complete len:360 (+) Transcript_2704:185-1264(+)
MATITQATSSSSEALEPLETTQGEESRSNSIVTIDPERKPGNMGEGSAVVSIESGRVQPKAEITDSGHAQLERISLENDSAGETTQHDDEMNQGTGLSVDTSSLGNQQHLQDTRPSSSLAMSSDLNGTSALSSTRSNALPPARSSTSSFTAKALSSFPGSPGSARGSARGAYSAPLVVPTWLSSKGWNFTASIVEEVNVMINYQIYARLFQIFVLFVSWVSAGANLGRLNSPFVRLSGLEWGLIVGILAWTSAIIQGRYAFLLLSPTAEEKTIRFGVRLNLFGDLFFVFATLSAFTSLAEYSSLSNVAVSATFMFFSWVTFIYTTPISIIMYKDRSLLLQRFSPLAAISPVESSIIANV